jgi:hypothetical protein
MAKYIHSSVPLQMPHVQCTVLEATRGFALILKAGSIRIFVGHLYGCSISVSSAPSRRTYAPQCAIANVYRMQVCSQEFGIGEGVDILVFQDWCRTVSGALGDCTVVDEVDIRRVVVAPVGRESISDDSNMCFAAAQRGVMKERDDGMSGEVHSHLDAEDRFTATAAAAAI